MAYFTVVCSEHGDKFTLPNVMEGNIGDIFSGNYLADIQSPTINFGYSHEADTTNDFDTMTGSPGYKVIHQAVSVELLSEVSTAFDNKNSIISKRDNFY